jgi:ribosome-binding ATPase
VRATRRRPIWPINLPPRRGLKQRLRTGVSAICGKVEAELAEMSESDAAEFLSSYGLKESAISRLINASYQLLGLISFFHRGGG